MSAIGFNAEDEIIVQPAKEKNVEETKKEKEISKWKSRRWLITVWAMIMISVLSVLGIIFKTDAYVPLVTTLVAIPVAFTSLETLNKKHKYQHKNEE